MKSAVPRRTSELADGRARPWLLDWSGRAPRFMLDMGNSGSWVK